MISTYEKMRREEILKAYKKDRGSIEIQYKNGEWLAQPGLKTKFLWGNPDFKYRIKPSEK